MEINALKYVPIFLIKGVWIKVKCSMLYLEHDAKQK